MRNLTVISMITLDGVMQAPGGPGEDPSNGFHYGGWVAPFGDEVSGGVMQRLMKPSDLLLGRKTFDIWEPYWPQHAAAWPSVNDVTKYVLSTTRNKSDWQNTVFLNNIEGIRELKASDGHDLQVWGSSKLAQALFADDLVDEFWLLLHPIVLGKGKKLFSDNASPSAFTLSESHVSGKGVILARYSRSGAVQTGNLAQ
ncbi:MAG: dihydrofolate reductase [Chitinophagaceae bacterium]|nr:MAG: dihydrofolate reductase [Chitinophagaceae bacterium]